MELFFGHFLTRLSDSSDIPAAATKKKKTKVGRKWGDQVPTEGDMASLDYSSDKPDGNNPVFNVDVSALVDHASIGTRTADGMYEVKDWEFGDKVKEDEMDKFISQALDSTSLKEKGPASTGTFGSSFGSLFARLTGSKTLTGEDLEPVLEGMKQHLMKKNVAKEIAEKVCEGVGESLIGKKVGSFQSTLERPAPLSRPN
jgi:signal recognition particle receptor subunit alpha